MRYGYIRPSITLKRKKQEEKIRKYGVDEIIVDQTGLQLIQLKNLVTKVSSKDVIVVYSLDRIGKKLRTILETLYELKMKGVQVIGLTDGFNLSQHGDVVELIHETEKSLLKERTFNGRKKAKPSGRPRLINKEVIAKAKQLRNQKKTYREISEELQVPLSTLHYHLSQ